MRPARERDVEALARLWHEADVLHAEISPAFFKSGDLGRGRQRASDALREIDGGGHEAIFVAVDGRDAGRDGGSVRGACHLQIYDTPAGQGMVPERRAHIETLIVARDHRRSGCGRALLRAATDWAKSRGAGQVILTVWAGNESAARFYEALGYRVISQVLGTDL